MEIFDEDPLDEQALVAALGGDVPPREYVDPEGPGVSAARYRLLFGTDPPPTRSRQPRTDIELPSPPKAQTVSPEAAKLKALMASMPMKPQSSQQLLDTLRNAPPIQPQMRAATPEERVVTKLEDEGAPDAGFVQSIFNARGPKPPAGPTAMRASTPRERVGDVLRDFGARFSLAPGADNDVVPEPFAMRVDPTMGSAAPEAMAGKAGKAMQAEARAVLEKLFPKLDAYAKQKSMLSPAKVLEMLKAHPETTPELLQSAEALAAKGGRKMKPGEVVDVLSGVKYDKGRVLRQGVERVTTKKLSGAPLWVTSPKKEGEALENYLKQVEDGVPGADFYKRSGGAFLDYAGDDPKTARKLGRAMASTSSATEVGVNTGFGVKGHNQATAGLPVKTGRFPTNMSKPIEQVYKGDIKELGPKHEPFAQQLAAGGGYADEGEQATRAVHDIWEGEAFGYVNPDGTPLRRGFNDAEHRWMDSMTDRAIAEANARKLGGKSDWDPGSLQAAAWTGARIRAGEIEAGEAAQSFADFMSRYHLQTGRDAVPGITTKHLPELAGAPLNVRQDYAKKVADILYDAKGREKAATAKGMLSGGSIEGPGIWTDATGTHQHPGRQVMQVAGTSTDAAGAKMLDPASEALIKANEAEYGLLMGQDAIAGSMNDETAKAAARNMFDVKLPTGTLQMNDPALSHPGLKAGIESQQIAAMAQPGGARVLNTGMEDDAFRALTRDFAKTAGADKARGGRNLGFYEGNAWDAPEGRVGQAFAKLIKGVPTGVEGFNKTAPQVAKQLNDLDVFMRDTHGMTLSDTMMQLREAIAAKGFDGINELATKLGVPLAALLLLLRTEQPSAQ